MNLSLGSVGSKVSELQDWLNKLPPKTLVPLVVDGIFGPKTRSRVQEFQRNNQLAPDGVVGPLTTEAIQQELRRLGLLPPTPLPAALAVRPINQEVLGMTGSNNLIQQSIPSISLIVESTFLPGVVTNQFDFRSAAPTVARLGIFAAKKGDLERAVILLLPPTGTPDRVIICISQGFAQAPGTLEPLGWGNPLSPDLIRFCLLKHVINRWGAQTLASRKQMAFMYIVRAKGNELGPFANDGPFVLQTLTELVLLTNGAFSFLNVEAFTFSSGISDFNVFLNSVSGILNVQAVYSIDPANALPAGKPAGAVRKQFLSGQTGGPSAGFEFVPLDRWSKEWSFPIRQTFGNPWQFAYLHNYCMPKYILHLAIQTS